MSRAAMCLLASALPILAAMPACGGPHFDWPLIHRTRVDDLRQRAAFDLQCPEQQLELTSLGEPRVHGGYRFYFQYGVTGCEGRAVYVDANQNIMITRANWVVNTQDRERPAAP